MNNVEIADLLRAASAAYEIKGGNRFKQIAYDRAADAVEHLSSEAKDIWDEGETKLEEVSGIGKSIASHLDEIFSTGKSSHFDKLFTDLSPAIFELLKIPGIGPKHAKRFADEFKLVSASKAVSQLLKAAKSGDIAKMSGFGQDSQSAVIAAIEEFKKKPKKRLLLSKAEEISQKMIKYMQKCDDLIEISTLGSLRRKASTVGDIDLAAASDSPEKVIKHFCDYPNKQRVLQKGERKAALILPGNIQVDLMVESPNNFGSIKQHFTGSKQHNILLREYAIKKGWKVSDYGITKNNKLLKIKTEREFYKTLGFNYIPPELREGTDELKIKKLPDLVELKDIKGDLHIHSNFAIETSHDVGDNSMKEIIKSANVLNYEYIAFTEHNPSQKNHNQKQVKNLLNKKMQKITQLNNELKNNMKTSVKRIFNSLEIDILPNGDLPVGDEALQELDFALVSIHSSFKQAREKQTERILKALDNPKVKIFAHPTARKLNEREGVELNWKEIFKFCVKNNKWVEINSSPQRLDLPDFLVREAIEAGVKIVISTDAHNVSHMNNMKYGVYTARRGWCEQKNIINTLSLQEFEKLL